MFRSRIFFRLVGTVSFILIIFMVSCSPDKTPLSAVDTDSGNSVDAEINCEDYGPSTANGQSETGAYYTIDIPKNWNGDLVIFAHGYIPANEPLQIPLNQMFLTDGTYLPDIIKQAGYAFATTSYSYNGYIIKDAVADLIDLERIFDATYTKPARIYLVGASEGALISVKTMEATDLFDGSLVICGPIGDMLRQINYMGDIRVVFDFYFPGILPGDVTGVPDDVIGNWKSVYLPRIKTAFKIYPERYQQFLNVINLPADPANPKTSVLESVIQLLWSNVVGANDLAAKLGGHPYDNTTKIYSGSDDDNYLNQHIARYSSDITGLMNLQLEAETTGTPQGEIISMFNTDDPFVKPWQALIYSLKTIKNNRFSFYNNIRVERYGHCTYSSEELLTVFKLLVLKVTLRDLFDSQSTDMLSSAFQNSAVQME